jgi:hypothetical protein
MLAVWPGIARTALDAAPLRLAGLGRAQPCSTAESAIALWYRRVAHEQPQTDFAGAHVAVRDRASSGSSSCSLAGRYPCGRVPRKVAAERPTLGSSVHPLAASGHHTPGAAQTLRDRRSDRSRGPAGSSGQSARAGGRPGWSSAAKRLFPSPRSWGFTPYHLLPLRCYDERARGSGPLCAM